ITLYGPREMTGAPTQYGERLARLCRALLGYRRAVDRPGHSALAGPGLTGAARVFLHERPLTFDLDAKLLTLLAPSDAGEPAFDRGGALDAGPQFDSSLEQRLHEQFVALERDGASRGWLLEREPDPILSGSTILVPDFALTRGARRVYLEIAGYWRPEYRERKARKLAAILGRVALVLAAPESARAEFAALDRDFPILWYKDTVSAEALLALLDREYDDLDVRLGQVDAASIAAEADLRGVILPAESMALLRCYSRAEFTRALALLQAHADATGDPAPEWVDGAGLCSPAWLADLLGVLREMVRVAEGQHLALAGLAAAIAARVPGAASEDTAERLARRAGLHVVRTSIFDADVRVEDSPLADSPPAVPSLRSPATQPRPRSRRTHTGTTSYSTQSIFPPERPGPDNPEPDIPTRAP
ncbi:MAG: DUF790 family protein, partial [Ktedonobacterales bacterium]